MGGNASDNWNILAVPNRERIVDALNIEVKLSSWHELYGNGNTAGEITALINNELQ